jgi:hypothetical protein
MQGLVTIGSASLVTAESLVYLRVFLFHRLRACPHHGGPPLQPVAGGVGNHLGAVFKMEPIQNLPHVITDGRFA